MTHACKKCGAESEWFVLLCKCYPGMEDESQEFIDKFNRAHDHAWVNDGHEAERERRYLRRDVQDVMDREYMEEALRKREGTIWRMV